MCGADTASLYLQVKAVEGDNVVCEAQNDAVLDGLMTVFHMERSADVLLNTQVWGGGGWGAGGWGCEWGGWGCCGWGAGSVTAWEGCLGGGLMGAGRAVRARPPAPEH